jgi:hypothetical protein
VTAETEGQKTIAGLVLAAAILAMVLVACTAGTNPEVGAAPRR